MATTEPIVDDTEIDENEFNLIHVILPRYLPAERQDYSKQLKLMEIMIDTITEIQTVPPQTIALFEQLKRLHIDTPPENFNNVLQNKLRNLMPDETFAMFVCDCTLMIHKDRDCLILATFRGDMELSDVYGYDSDLQYQYPSNAIEVKSSHMLQSDHFINQLCFLHSKYSVDKREFVSKWLMTLLADADSKTASRFPIIMKKIRHELIREKNQNIFRRSRVYMSMKVLLQHSLTRQMGAELGKFMYKVVMLNFFNKLCEPYMKLERVTFNIELLSQMIAKMARRIEKVTNRRPKRITDDLVYLLYDQTIEQSKNRIETINSKIRKQISEIHQHDAESLITSLEFSDFESDLTHKFPNLMKYLDTQISDVEANVDTDAGFQTEYKVKSYDRHMKSYGEWPDIESIAEINAKTDDTRGNEYGGFGLRLFWADFENRILYSNGWINRSADFLRQWASEYSKYAEQMYGDDQLLKSRMLLVHLKLIEVLDRRLCNDTQYPLLRKHKSCINPEIINALLLPQYIDMEIAYNLQRYFEDRNKNASNSGLIEEKRVSEHSFSVRFAKQNDAMKEVLAQILKRDEENVQKKRREWEKKRQLVCELRKEISAIPPCFGTACSNCSRCRKNKKIVTAKIDIYERLLPDNDHEQMAIVFELQIPRAIACLRDILHGFAKLFAGNTEKESFKDWVDRPGINEYKKSTSNESNQSVQLGSTIRSSARKCHVDKPFETKFIVSNASNCIFHADHTAMPPPIANAAIKTVCTPFKLKDEYRILQWTLNGTGHTENEVLAQKSECPRSLSISEYTNFGTLRADGHRLQFRKLYAMIETEGLSFEKESVLALIMQTLWECGINNTTGEAQIVRESHIDFTDQVFCLAIVARLDSYAKQQKHNWMHSFKLLMVTLTAVRIFEINNHPHSQVVNEQVVNLLMDIREIVFDWIEQIESAIHEIQTPDEDRERQLRLKLIYVAIIGGLTFFIHSKHRHFEMIVQQRDFNSQTAPQQWLNFIITLKSNMQVYTQNETQLPAILRMFLRLIERIGIDLETRMKGMICENPDQIYKLIRLKWPRSVSGEFESVNFHGDFEEILIVSTIVDNVRQTATIDIITGSFLINGKPISRLPTEILKSNKYRWFFGDVAFEVQPENERSFSTLKKYNGCLYEFKKLNNDIIIIERNDFGIVRDLIHHTKLKGDFPSLLIENYSHWWNRNQKCLEFRKRNPGNRQFSKEKSIEYSLDSNTCRLTHLKSGRPLFNIKSGCYEKLVQQLKRLEHRNYILVLLEKDKPKIVTIELLRLKLKFKLDFTSNAQNQTYQLESNEFSGMRVSCQQNIGTLFGLKHGLILESSERSAAAQTKILLIPNGKVQTERVAKLKHVSVTIGTEKGVRNPPFYKYEVDEFCQQLKANNSSHAAWFYLAYLHAVTSHGEIEPFTGMSGTERSLQILQSAFSWSSAPYEPEAMEILRLIAKLSPIRKLSGNFQSVTWPEKIPPRSAQDSFVFIVKKLYEDSQRLHGLYSKDSAQNLKFTQFDLKLNERDYHRCLQLQPNMRVGHVFIKPKVLRTSLPKSIGVSFSENTQIISLLYHTNQYKIPKNQNFLKILLTHKRKQLIGLDQQNYAAIVTHLLNHTGKYDFADIWINLYNTAREEKCSQEEFALVFSLLAHRNEDMDAILALHVVAKNPDKFDGIKPPKIAIYSISDGIYSGDEASSILRSFFSKQQNISETLKTSIVDELKSQIRWPCKSVEFGKKPKFPEYDYNYQAANKAVNDLLESWYKRDQLEKFIKKVQNRLKTLRPNSTSSNSMVRKYDPFVAPEAPKEWPKFEIDVEKKISDHLDDEQFVEFENQAHNIWEENRDGLDWRSTEACRAKIEKILHPPEYQHLIHANLFPRAVPSLLLPKILENADQRLKSLIGAWGVAIAREQHAKRIEIYRYRPDCEPDMEREQQNPPHVNWKPCDRPEWLLFEIEQNLTIREIQVKVANRMMNPPTTVTNTKHSVMQLNMGEGKTSVIIPMLAAALANGDQVCQITVLKALLRTNLRSLRQYLGGMLNQRIYMFPCRRDMAITKHIQQIRGIFEECKIKKGVILTQPDHRLSFQLKLYESIEKDDANTIEQYLETHQWINANVRNILDESDAILQPNYQLVYTVGNQLLPDGGEQRWQVIQALLKRVPYHMRKIHQSWDEAHKCNPMLAAPIEFDVNYVADGHVYSTPNVNYRTDVFIPCRILDDTIFDDLKLMLANDFLDGRLDIGRLEIDESEKNQLRTILTEREIGLHALEIVRRFRLHEQNVIMILSGLLRFEVLKLALTKRWRVNYGVNPTGQRKMAIPFKAKDVPAEMSEFGHPDVAICLTQLSYYYSGLTNAELCQLFAILASKENAQTIYGSWFNEDIAGGISRNLVDPTIATFSSLNLDDPNQRDGILFPLLRHNMKAIDFWLANVVYPYEAKIFEKKLMCTAWDLCSDQTTLCVTGFSGTNDTKKVLPLPITQNDLQELQSTNENMQRILIKNQHDQSYTKLPKNITGMKIIEHLSERKIPVLLDAGALILELTNEQVAIEWLSKAESNFEASVYFDSNDVLQTIDRRGVKTEFDCSVYRENLRRCIVYLDDVHTRGTDLKFPLDWMACVTLSGDITRDKTVQSCMRMRQLGKGQSISFLASYEADIRLRKVCNLTNRDHDVTNEHVIEFICHNSTEFVIKNMVHWTASALNYTKKLIGHKLFENANDEDAMEKLYEICVDDEFAKLFEMYSDKKESLLTGVAWSKFDILALQHRQDWEILSFIRAMQSDVVRKLDNLAPNVRQFSHALDEEQQKELEQEQEPEEERQPERAFIIQAAKPQAPSEKFESIVKDGVTAEDIVEMKSQGLLYSIADSLSNTQLDGFAKRNQNAWADHLFVSSEFKTVIEGDAPVYDEYLRPVLWIVRVQRTDATDRHILVLLSSYETNLLMPILRESLHSTLFMYRPRLSQLHSNLLRDNGLRVAGNPDFNCIDIDMHDEAQIGMYAGSMYFANAAEESAYCEFMGIVPSSGKLKDSFDKGEIPAKGKGFIFRRRTEIIRKYVGQCKFVESPVDFAIELIEARHQSLQKESHVASILELGNKVFKQNDIETESNDEDDDDL